MVYQAYGGISNPTPMTGDQNRKIFLGGLNYHTTDETLRAFCSRFGKITDCLVMRNPEGKSRGFGFVTYEDTSSVEDFMRSRPHTIDNRQIDPKRAMPREEQNSSEAHLTVKKLFVAGLREGINEESLRVHFSRFGNIVEILVMKDRDGKPRGFAFVTFDDYDAVDKAVLEKPHVINGRNLDVKKAVPKEKMQEGSGLDSSPSGSGMSPYNRSNSANYSGPNGGGGGGGPAPAAPSRNNFGPMRDNFNNSSGSWDNQGGMSRMNNQNQNYNQPPASSYGQQSGYNANVSNFTPPMPPTNSYSQPYNSMGQNQPPPPPPPPLPQQQSSLMNYDMYNNNSTMPFNNNPNQPPSSNYMQPSPQSYGQNQQQGFGNNPNNFGGMNNPFNLPQPPSSVGNGGYNNLSSTSAPYDNSSSFGITSQPYGGGGNSSGGGVGNYNNMPQQQSRGGGPVRNGRGGGGGNYGGSSGNEGGYGNRSAPYSTRGGGRGGRGGGRGRGRGQ